MWHNAWHYGLIAFGIYCGLYWSERLCSQMGGKITSVDKADMVILWLTIIVFTLFAREYNL